MTGKRFILYSDRYDAARVYLARVPGNTKIAWWASSRESAGRFDKVELDELLAVCDYEQGSIGFEEVASE